VFWRRPSTPGKRIGTEIFHEQCIPTGAVSYR
jgi:hypothetical protein